MCKIPKFGKLSKGKPVQGHKGMKDYTKAKGQVRRFLEKMVLKNSLKDILIFVE